MITSYTCKAGKLLATAGLMTAEQLASATWIDLLAPTPTEEQHLESLLGIDLPTREEMSKIEDSRRLFARGDTLLLTLTILLQSDDEYPCAEEVTFVLTPQHLVSVRYVEPRALSVFAARSAANTTLCANAEDVLLSVLETLLEYLAIHVDTVSNDLDLLGHQVLAPDARSGRQSRLDYAALLRRLEHHQAVTAKSRTSLVSLGRLLGFVLRAQGGERLSAEARTRGQTLLNDTHSLLEHTGFLANNISFELAAILGMVNIEQNGIIKFFSVVSVVFLPPTLVASLYGMNFHHMPELQWRWGYPLAVLLMLVSAVLPYFWFRRKGWL